MLKFVEKIKDPIWGWIPITEFEKEIINSSVFKRLRHVKQMSMAYITYVGANHTRYEHSIGTMYAAYRIGINIPKIEEVFKDKFDYAIQLLRISALLHDIGHPPFSHAVEWTFKKNPELAPFENYSHDEYSKKIILESKELNEIFSSYVSGRKNADAHINAIAALAIGDESFVKKTNNPFLQSLMILIPINNGDLDSDKIDYILRDNYHCGFPTGVDFEEVLDAFDLYFDITKPEKSNLLLKREHIVVVETLLHSRLKLMDIIHHEMKNRIANHMLMKIVARNIQKLKNSERIDVIDKMHKEWTDNDMYKYISENSENNTAVRLFGGEILRHHNKFELKTLPPHIRRILYLLSKRPEELIKIQDKLENEIQSTLYIDLCFINPPPLTLQISEGTPERRPFLYDLSKIIDGILLESFRRSFLAIYSDSPAIENNSDIRPKLINYIEQQGNEILEEMQKENKIWSAELIICILEGISEFAKKHIIENNKSQVAPTWIPAITKLQKFIYQFYNNVLKNKNYEVKDSNLITNEYNTQFFREIKQLVFCGLIDQRYKLIQYEHPSIYYNDRIDNKINSNGKFYYQSFLKNKWEEIVNEIEDYLIEEKEIIKKVLILDDTADKVNEYNKFKEEIEKLNAKIAIIY